MALSQSYYNWLDALVAEEVMGWKWYTACGYSYLVPPEAQPYFNDFWVHWTLGKTGKVDAIEHRYSDRKYDHCKMLKFSTSINEAMKVVAKMGDWNGFEFVLAARPKNNPGWLAGWVEYDNSGFEWRVQGQSGLENPALAICIAALYAVNVNRRDLV